MQNSNTHPWVFFTFFKLYKWYQIAQNITNKALDRYRSSDYRAKFKTGKKSIFTPFQ